MVFARETRSGYAEKIGDSINANSVPPRAGDSTRKRQRRPNIVLIVGDDIGVDLVGAYAHYFPQTADRYHPRTPVLDALAAEGVLFRNAWTNPACSASRAQILTGRHSRRTGIGGIIRWRVEGLQPKNNGLTHDIPVLPQILKRGQNPYDTAAVGKWHLGTPEQGGLHVLGPAGKWFDRWAGSPFNLNGEGVGYRHWPKTFATRIGPADECGPPYPCVALLDESKACENYATVDTVDDAVHLLGTISEPFFLYVSFNAAHTPLDLPGCPLPPSRGGRSLEFSDGISTNPERTRAMVRAMDHQIGRLLSAVDPTDTYVIFIGDNGTAGRNANDLHGGIVDPFPVNHGKATMYNGGINVPLIVRGPRVVPSMNEELVSSTDLFATIAELARVADETSIPSDSVSIVPYLYGQSHPTPRETIHAERFVPTYVPANVETGAPPAGYRSKRHNRAIRNRRFKLIERRRDGKLIGEEFFDLAQGGLRDSEGRRHRDDFEQNDLMLSRDQWQVGGVVEENYWALKQELDVVLPPLP